MEFVIWITLSAFVGMYAPSKGRSGFGFFLLSILLSPLIGGLAALVTQPDQHNLESSAIRDGFLKKCPDCAEIVKEEARVCKHCGLTFPVEEVEPQLSKPLTDYPLIDNYDGTFFVNGKLFTDRKEAERHRYANHDSNTT